MNTQPNDGGPAFPRPASEYEPNGMRTDGKIAAVPFTGMTLRDYFAGQALMGGITTAKGLGQIDAKKRSEMLSEFSDLIFEIADAMIAARERKEGDQ